MTDVALVRSKTGAFRSCKAEGHAGFAAEGSDIVCSAVTSILRTALQVLSKTPGVIVTADTASRGNLAFSVEVKKAEPETEPRLACTADFISEGIRMIAEEYPEYVQLREQKD